MPSHPLRVCVVADDLSGAADTAVQFLRSGEETLLLTLGEAAAPEPEAGAGLAIDTGTRGLDPAQAAPRLRMAAGIVRLCRPALVYHKMDSQLRGRPGLEIETVRRELGLRCALVAPAHPDQGRVTIDGVHLVRGVPTAEGEAGRDPVAPVTESCLPRLLARQAGVPVTHLHHTDLDNGPDALRRTLERLLSEGHRLITCDAGCRQHLDVVAAVVAGGLRDALLAGSAGLATALAARLRPGEAAGSAAMRPASSMLFVCGSASRSLRRQVALLRQGRCQAVVLTPSSLAGEGLRALTRAATAAWEACDLVVQAPHERREGRTAPGRILSALAALGAALANHRKPGALFLSGGDTARAILGAAGVSAIRLRGEVIPGAPWGVAQGGALDGVTVVTMSGSFGRDQDLVAVHRRCRKDGAR